MKHIIVIFFLFAQYGFSQAVFRHEVFNGGVCVAGFSTGMGVGEGVVELFVEPGSTIKRTLLMVYTCGANTEGEVRINGQSFVFNHSNIVASNELLNTFYTPINLHVLDITEWFTNNETLSPIFETIVHPEMPFRGVFAPMIYLEYENAALPLLTSTILINDQPIFGSNNYSVTNLNPISTANPVGFSLYTDRHSYNEFERSHVYFNNNYLGLVYGSDAVNQFWSGGVKGHFFYQNNMLYGLDDDVANNAMNEADALADVSFFINDQSTSVSFLLQQVNYPNILPSALNAFLAYFLTYTSSCQPFNATLLTPDTTTCANVPVQLGASGGNTSGAFQAYDWLPQQNLSCYDCPNPIFIGDSTMNYTVRIRNTDSCSVVYPVRVRVLPNPSFESIEISESVCGGATGSIAVASSGLSQPHSYAINEGAPQETGTFNNLAAGEYTVTVSNADGCSVDSTVFVGEFNNLQAAFSVNPTTGAAPLEVQISNQSQNASEYFWNFSNQDGTAIYQGSGSLSGVEAPLAGVYTLTLIAGNGAAHCNDTTSALIFVEEPFVVFAYTHVTDEADVYQVFFSGVSDYDYKIYALDGKLVYQKSGSLEAAGNVDLWQISKLSSGMYVFRIMAKDLDGKEHEVDGKVVVVR